MKKSTLLRVIFSLFFGLNLFSQNLENYDPRLYEMIKSGKEPKEIEKIFKEGKNRTTKIDIHSSKVETNSPSSLPSRCADPDAYFGWDGHYASVRCLAYNKQGTMIASCGKDGTVRLWNTSTFGLKNVFFGKYGERYETLAFSPDGTILAAGSVYGIKLWNLNTGILLNTLPWNYYHVWALAFSPDGTNLASGGSEGYVKIWKVSTGELSNSFLGHTEGINSIAYSPDGAILASASDDKTVKIWNPSTGALILH